MQHKLSGIERELVLKYLQDANVPVTVTLLESLPETGLHSPSSAVFPVALASEKMTVLNQGIILLKNPGQAVASFAGKDVRVEFYFNRVGLCFITKMTHFSSDLALVIPEEISRIDETPVQKTNAFSADIFYGNSSSDEVVINCPAATGYRLFSKPVWKDIPVEAGHVATSYLDKIVADARARDVLGNGIQLIPVCRFLASGSGGIKALQGRAENPEVLYVNHECIVFAQKSEKFAFKPGIEFNLKLYFPVELKTAGMFREGITECCVQSVYSDDKNEKTCAVCSFVSMKEEDIRFVYEMTTKNLFI